MDVMRVSFVVLLVGASVTCHFARAENWPQWRGPQGSGLTAETGLPTEWDREKNVVWRVPLPEDGNSTPVVWGDRIFVSQPLSDSKQRTLMCFARDDGRKLWQAAVTYEADESSHRTNPYCSPSPVTDGERVIAWFGSAGLFCYDLEGNEQWRRDLGPQEHMWGYGTSPIMYRDLCILNFGPGNREVLLAVDKRTGEEVWRVEPLSLDEEDKLSGPENNGNADPKDGDGQRSKMLRGTWSTPILVEAGGRNELVVTHPRRVTAYEPATGELLWTCGGSAPLVYASPMRAEDTVVALGGYAGGSLAVRAGGKGDVTESQRVWHKNRDGSYLGTGVARNGHVFVCDMNGILYCFEVATGEEVWKERLTASTGRASTWSSMSMTADGTMYVLIQNGDTFVGRVSPSWL